MNSQHVARSNFFLLTAKKHYGLTDKDIAALPF